LAAVDRLEFDAAPGYLEQVEGRIGEARTGAEDEDVLNDLFVLERLLVLYRAYAEWWSIILAGEFGRSWAKLQAALAALTALKRFSRLNVEALEEHLLQVESVYPYKVFASVGVVVPQWDCSVCGEDIDGRRCTHRRNQLYAGKVAYAIAREIRSDHIALVENPVDRMCIVGKYNDEGDFPVIGYLRDQVSGGHLRPSEVLRFEQRTEVVRNPAIPRQGRNERCACGSGKKHKKCCAPRATVERRHIELIPMRRDATALLPLRDTALTSG
jgi:hypothetical protein